MSGGMHAMTGAEIFDAILATLKNGAALGDAALVRSDDRWFYVDEVRVVHGHVAFALGMEAPDPHPSAAPYVVIRFEDGYPDEFKPDGMDGLWMHRPPPTDSFPFYYGASNEHTTATATDRVEMRADGERAQVYEVRAPNRATT